MSAIEAAIPWLNKVHELPDNLKKRYSSYHIYITFWIANVLMFANGFCLNWTAPVLPKLLSNDSNINPLGRSVSTIELSMLAAAPYLTGLLGFLVMAKLSDLIGRKKTMMCSALINTFSFNAIAFANNINVYYIFLLFLGFSIAGIFVSVSVYSIEISDKTNRDRLGSMLGFAIATGFLASFVFGSMTSVKIFTIISALPALAHLLLAPFFIVESPVYLCVKGEKDEALRSLEYLRGCSSQRDIEMEYLAILFNINENDKQQNTIFDLFKTKKALFLSIFLCVGQQTSGITVILTFVGIIFKDAGSNLTGDTVGILIGCEQVLVITLVTYLIKKYDRKYLLLVSCLIASFSIFALSICLFFKQTNPVLIEHTPWLPAVSALVFMAGYSLGYGPIPIALCGELFPNNLRSIGVAVSLLTESLFIFIIKFTYPLLSEVLGLHFTLFIYGVTGLLNFVIFYLYLPKTKGKSLSEIQNSLAK